MFLKKVNLNLKKTIFSVSENIDFNVRYISPLRQILATKPTSLYGHTIELMAIQKKPLLIYAKNAHKDQHST